MKKLIPLAIALSACMAPEDYPSHVSEVTDRTVTIRAWAGLTPKPALPNLAMQAQADEICPGAEYLSTRPDYQTEYPVVLHLFLCPQGGG